MLFNGIYLELLVWSLKTECLWLNVPLPESCPTNRTGKPSSNNEPKANDSAVDPVSYTHLTLPTNREV